MPYGTGNCAYRTCMAKVAFLSIFHIFHILHDSPQNNLHGLPQKNQFFFYNLHDLRKKKNTRIYRNKQLHDLMIFFVHESQFSWFKGTTSKVHATLLLPLQFHTWFWVAKVWSLANGLDTKWEWHHKDAKVWQKEGHNACPGKRT